MRLTSDAVRGLVKFCLFQGDELKGYSPPAICPAEMVMVEGVVCKFGFHRGRIEESKPWIKALLSQLPLGFFEKGPRGENGLPPAMGGQHAAELDDKAGGGWSFLAACETREGERWGEHWAMDELFCLGMAAGLVTCQLPREMWHVLPGGVPYYSISREVLG